MKKLFYTIASLAALTAIACSKEQDTPEVRPEKPEEIVEVPASLSGSMGDPTTKVSSDNNGAYKWQASDHVTILTNNGSNRDFSADEAGLTTEFSGHIPSSDELEGGFALYPASEGHSITGTTITFNIPTELTWGAEASYMPMYAPIVEDDQDAEKVKAAFKAVGGAMKLICYNIPSGATTLAFTAKSVNIAGDFTLDTTAGTPVLSGEGGGKEIDIDFTDNYSANKVFYIPLPPVTLTGGFTITFYDSDVNTLFEKTTTAAPEIGRNQLIIAPALNCGAAPADATLTNAEIVAKHWSSGSYATDSITNSFGTWNFNAAYAGNYGGDGKYYMQLRNDATVSYLQLPTFSAEIASIILHSVCNASNGLYTGSIYLRATADNNAAAIATAPSASSAKQDLTMTIPEGYSKGYIMVSGACRIAAFTVKFRGTDATIPAISADADELTIPVGSLSATISNVALANNVDELGISVDIVSQTPAGWIDTAVLENGTLTVTAKAANANAADNTATIKLKASGAAAYPVTVTQTSCLVQAPASYTALAGDETATITWTKDEHASSYLAYLHTAPTETPATGGTDVTNDLTLSNGTYSLTKGSLTNNTTYYLYVKVNAVAPNYQASTAYTSVSFTPRKASTEEDPYKASEAYDNISSYASGEGPVGDIYVEGYVYTAEAPASNSQTYTIIWGDATTKALQIYEGKQISNANITDVNKVSVGDYVKVKGAAINYNGDTPRLTSGNVILTHYPKLAAPTFSLAPGLPDDVDENKFYETQTVTLNATNEADIYYTLDGTAPTTSSTHYTSPFAVSSTTPIKAIAVKANYTNSAVAEKAITIEAPTQLVMSTIYATADEDFINFSWEAVDHATGYQVSTDGGDNYGETQAATSYKWENLTPSTSYTLYVKAIGTTNKKYTDSAAGSKTQSTNAPTPGWKETALSNISAGDVFVIVGDAGYALPHNNGTSDAPSTVSVAVSGTKMTGSEGNDGVIADKIKWNVSGNNEDGYVFYPNGSTTTWLYCTTNNNGVRVGTNVNKLFTLTNDGYLLNTATSRYISVYNNNDWRCYTSTNNNPQVVKFYKYTDNRAASGIKWTADGSDAAVVSAATGIMLTGADTAPAAALYNPHSRTVTYSSSNTDVAEISNAGVVTLKSAGEGVTISASFAGDATYKPSTVSYTLTVTDSRTIPVINLDTSDENRTDSDYTGFTGRTATTTPASTNELPIVLTYTKTDASGVISSINATTGALTLSGTAGTATVTVSFAGTTEYKPAVSKSYSIKVTSGSGPEPLDYPTSVAITAISATGFTASWTAPASGAPLGYSWKLTTTNDSAASAVSGGSGTSTSEETSVTVSSGITLTSGQNYYFHIKATGDNVSYTESTYNSSAAKSFTDYSTVYTSNVTLPTSGTNVSSCKVSISGTQYDGTKLGKNGSGATTTITVPANTTKLYIHCAAWNGKSSSLSVTTNASGVTINPSTSWTLTSDSGIASNSPFTLNATAKASTDYFKVYTLTGVTSATTITIAASGERAVFWGVNAVSE